MESKHSRVLFLKNGNNQSYSNTSHVKLDGSIHCQKQIIIKKIIPGEQSTISAYESYRSHFKTMFWLTVTTVPRYAQYQNKVHVFITILF